MSLEGAAHLKTKASSSPNTIPPELQQVHSGRPRAFTPQQMCGVETALGSRAEASEKWEHDGRESRSGL